MRINKNDPVEQHASWIAINPVVGCPMSCAYCFLRPEGLNRTAPQYLFTPEETINQLLSSKYYLEDLPVAIGTRTDMFANPKNIQFATDFIKKYNEAVIKNPLIFITKCFVPQEFIELCKELESKGSKFVFFLSYSGLKSDIELGINHDRLRDNFVNLSKNGMTVIHYWRPFVPQNSTEEAMTNVIEHTAKYSKASVIAGLRLTPEMKNQFWFWGQIQDMDIDFDEVEGIWPKNVQPYLEDYFRKQYPKHPMGYAASCALAVALKRPDYNGFYGTGVCKSNFCPDEQRNLCQTFFENNIVTEDMVKMAFNRLGIEKDTDFKLALGGHRLILDKPLPHGILVNLTQTLKIPVDTKAIDDGYGWGSSVGHKEPLYVDISNEQAV